VIEHGYRRSAACLQVAAAAFAAVSIYRVVECPLGAAAASPRSETANGMLLVDAYLSAEGGRAETATAPIATQRVRRTVRRSHRTPPHADARTARAPIAVRSAPAAAAPANDVAPVHASPAATTAKQPEASPPSSASVADPQPASPPSPPPPEQPVEPPPAPPPPPPLETRLPLPAPGDVVAAVTEVVADAVPLPQPPVDVQSVPSVPATIGR
jgi:hypothetical protein